MEKIPTVEKSRKIELKTEFGALRKDWIERKGINLKLLKYSELKEHINEFYKENKNLINEVLETKEETLEHDLGNISSKRMDYERVNKIRQSLDLPKWVSLSETVAFIKTVLDYDDSSIKEGYVDYCSKGISLDEMRNVLAYENDVKPARLDTDIYHQSPHRSRAAVEIVSNAIDAMQPANKSIGRFGVGFYQILSHLNSEEDRVKIETGNEKTGFYTIEFRLKNKEIEFSLKENEDQKEKGTRVSLATSNFPAEEAEKLVKKHFSYNNVARVVCNGEKVNKIETKKEENDVGIEINNNGFSVIDKGVGMSPQVILEKLLVPKISGKQPIGELIKEQNIQPEYFVERFKEGETGEGKIVINVGGVMIEEIPIKGTRTVKTLVLEMPSFTLLGEERNAIAVDEVTVEASKKIIDRITSEGDVSVLNSLVPAIKKMQERSRLYEQKDNLISYLQEKTKELLKESKDHFLPNTQEFERVDLPNVTLIDPLLKQSAWKTITGMKMPNLKDSGDALYVAPLKYSDEFDPIVITGKNRAVLDKNIYELLKEDPTLINLYLKSFSEGKSIEIRKIVEFDPEKSKKESEIVEQNGERKEYKNIQEFVLNEWEQLGPPDLFTAIKRLEFPKEQIHNKNMGDIENNIINKFPISLTKKFFQEFVFQGYWRDFTKENAIIDISSLAQNPELLNILAELDICPFKKPEYNTRKKTEIEKFPGLSSDYKDKIEKLSTNGLGWYRAPYYGEKVLLSGDGKMFRGDFQINKDGKRIAWYDDANKRLKFINTETGEFEKNEILFEDFSSKHEEKIVFADILGEECVGLTQLRSGIPEYKNNNDRRSYNEMLFFKVSDGKQVLTDIGKGRITTGIYSWGKEFIDCERPNPIYNPRNDSNYSFGESRRKGPYSTIDGIINPKTGKISEKGEEWDEIRHKFVLENLPSQYTHEITPRIKMVFDRDAQLMQLFIDGEIKQRIHAEIQDDPKETFDSKYYPNVKMDTFGEKDNEGLLIKNKRSDYFNYIYQEDRWSEKKERSQKIEWLEDKIINSEGVAIYEGKINETITKITGSDSKEYFMVSELPFETLQDGKKYVVQKSRDRYFVPSFVLDTDGKKIEGDGLKNILPFEFRVHVGEHGTTSKISLYESNYWKAEINLSSGITIIGKDTKKELFEMKFSNVIYIPEKNVWECLKLHKYNTPKEVVFLNEKGEIVEEGTVMSCEYLSGDNFEKTSFLSKEKTILLQKVIEGYEDQDIERIKLLLERTFEHGELNDSAYRSFAPMLPRLDYLHPSLVNNELIESLEKRIGNYDINNQVFFYEFLSRSIPESTKNILSEQEIFLEKFIKIFNEKIAVLPIPEKEEIFKSMSELRNYRDEYLTTGWSIIQNKTLVPTELIPEKIRPIVEYLRTDEKESMSYKEKPAITMENKNSQFTLSQLIQTKRLNETEISQFSGSIEKLIETVNTKTKGKHQEHIQREIIHPIYYQSINNPYLFIRELVQNAHDALVESKEANKAVSIDLLSRSEESLTVRIEDPVGMTKKILLNYFLVPGETTKKDKKDQIGYFGQGLFTLFRGSKEVLVKTGIGDGMVTKMKITPHYNEDGTLADLDITMEEEKSDYKGTTIEKTMDTKYPQVEAAYIKNATCSFTSLVDANIININLNDTQINQPQTIMSQVSVPELGNMKIYEAPNNVVTQRGLFVKSVDADYDSGMHDVESLLHKRGYVLQIPDGLDLTRSRNEIAQKEKVLPAIQEQIPLLKIGAYIEFFRKDIARGSIIQLDNLPYDFFYEKGSGSGIAYEDAKRIRNGYTIKDVSPYKDHGTLINLLIHLPVAELDEKTWSMYELRDASLENKAPLDSKENFEKLPKMLQKYLREGKSTYDSNERAYQRAVEKGEIVEDFSLENLEKQPEFIKELISKNKEAYERFNELAKSWLKYLDSVFFKNNSRNTSNTFFHTTESVSAHASHFLSMVGWNLNTWRGWNVGRFQEENLKDDNIREFLDVLSHEYAHVIEKTNGMTHNKDFYIKQSQVLAKMIQEKLKQSK